MKSPDSPDATNPDLWNAKSRSTGGRRSQFPNEAEDDDPHPLLRDTGFQKIGPSLPYIAEGVIPDLALLRDSRENFYLGFIVGFNIFVFSALLFALVVWPRETLIISLGLITPYVVFSRVSWKLAYAMLYGHSIKIGPNQYPHFHRLFQTAAILA